MAGVTVNKAAILNKLNHYLSSPGGKAKKSAAMLNGNAAQVATNNALAAANELASLLNAQIMASAIHDTSSLANAACVGVYNTEVIGDEVVCSAGVSFTGNLSRPSLLPSVYGGVFNIVELLNFGYTAKAAVYAKDGNGNTKWSLSQRAGAHFIESAVALFRASGGGKYGVKSVTVNAPYA